MILRAISNQGTWIYSNSKSPFTEYGYRHDGNAQKGKLSARFSVKLPKSGAYKRIYSLQRMGSDRNLRSDYEP